MGGKGKKKRNSKGSVDSTNSNGGGKSGGGKKKGGKSRKKITSGKSGAKFQGDIFNEGAMENAYFCCHNVQDVLKARGFPWPEAAKKKKKGKKK